MNEEDIIELIKEYMKEHSIREMDISITQHLEQFLGGTFLSLGIFDTEVIKKY